jgi:hypothetical protein
MKIISWLFLFFLIGSNCHSQSGGTVKQARAFLKVSSPGTVMADENGNQVRRMIIQRCIYIETPINATLAITRITAGKKLFTGVAERIYGTRVEVGRMFGNNRKVILNAAKDNKLWKIEVNPVAEQDQSYEKTLRNIQVSGKLNGKKFTTTILKEIQLAGDLYQ